MECTPRHARRYMDELEDAGYCIDSTGKRPPRFYIFEDESRQQADFTEEEAQLLQEALATISDTNPLLAPLRQKIYQHSTLLPLANTLVDQHQAQVVARLSDAIRDRRQVRLLRYHSINSNSICDRFVEPYSFSENFTQLTAFEPESDTIKTFKTQRIEDRCSTGNGPDKTTFRSPHRPIRLAWRTKKSIAATYLSGVSPIKGRVPTNSP